MLYDNGGSEAAAGTYAMPDGKAATAPGTWSYANEVVYPFGYGESYTTFAQSIDEAVVAEDRKTAEVTVTTTNTGNASGKAVVQVYGASPYTDYDRANHVEKSAIQLLDFENGSARARRDHYDPDEGGSFQPFVL